MAAALLQARSSPARRSMDIDEQTPGYCVIPDEGGRRILVLAGGDGAWTLPIVRVNEEWWSPNWLGRINGQIERQLGLRVTVLRHLQGPPLWVLELECHGAGSPAPPHARWVSRRELSALRLDMPELRPTLEPWTVFAPAARLRDAFALAEQLRPVWRAVRARRQLPLLEPASPWARDLARSIPATLRQAITRLGA